MCQHLSSKFNAVYEASFDGIALFDEQSVGYDGTSSRLPASPAAKAWHPDGYLWLSPTCGTRHHMLASSFVRRSLASWMLRCDMSKVGSSDVAVEAAFDNNGYHGRMIWVN